MRVTLVQHVWRGRGNTFTLRLDEVHSDGTVTPVDFVAVLSMMVRIGAHELTVTAGTAGGEIDWYDPALNTGEIKFTLGEWAETEEVMEGDYNAELIAFDGPRPQGIVLLSEDKRELIISVHENA